MYREAYDGINFDIIINRIFVGFYEREFKCANGHLKYSFLVLHVINQEKVINEEYP